MGPLVRLHLAVTVLGTQNNQRALSVSDRLRVVAASLHTMGWQSQVKEPWTRLVAASLAAGLALCLLRVAAAQQQASHRDDQNSVIEHKESCQDEDHVAAMDAETRAYHEGFMREAIAMVNIPVQLSLHNCS